MSIFISWWLDRHSYERLETGKLIYSLSFSLPHSYVCVCVYIYVCVCVCVFYRNIQANKLQGKEDF